MRVGYQKMVMDGREWKWNEEKSEFETSQKSSEYFKQLNKKTKTKDETGIDKGYEKVNELGIVKEN